MGKPFFPETTNDFIYNFRIKDSSVVSDSTLNFDWVWRTDPRGRSIYSSGVSTFSKDTERPLQWTEFIIWLYLGVTEQKSRSRELTWGGVWCLFGWYKDFSIVFVCSFYGVNERKFLKSPVSPTLKNMFTFWIQNVYISRYQNVYITTTYISFFNPKRIYHVTT